MLESGWPNGQLLTGGNRPDGTHQALAVLVVEDGIAVVEMDEPCVTRRRRGDGGAGPEPPTVVRRHATEKRDVDRWIEARIVDDGQPLLDRRQAPAGAERG